MDAISRDRLKGIYAPLATPFAENEDLDFDALKHNMSLYRQSSLRGYLVLGSNGENKSLSADEKQAVLDTVVAGRADEQVVVAGVMYEAQRHAEQFLATLTGRGIDLALVQSPSYFKKLLTEDCLYRYFTALADMSPVPLMIYHCPVFNGIELSFELLSKLATHPNIVGMKDSTSGSDPKIMDLDSESFCVMVGSISKLRTFVARGCIGGTVSFANYCPNQVAELQRQLESGSEDAESLNTILTETNKRIAGPFGVPGVKAAMSLLGFKGGIPRKPYLSLPPAQVEEIKATLVGAGILNP